jgi:hypothetical protein
MVITVAVIATAEVARPVRFVNILFGLALLVTPFAFEANIWQMAAGLLAGAALIVLSLPRGTIHGRYGRWNHLLV